MSRATSIRLSDDLIGKLDELAASVDRSRAWVIEQAITRYVAEEAWQVAAIKSALNDYRSGGSSLKPHGAVMAEVDEKIRARAQG